MSTKRRVKGEELLAMVNEQQADDDAKRKQLLLQQTNAPKTVSTSHNTFRPINSNETIEVKDYKSVLKNKVSIDAKPVSKEKTSNAKPEWMNRNRQRSFKIEKNKTNIDASKSTPEWASKIKPMSIIDIEKKSKGETKSAPAWAKQSNKKFVDVEFKKDKPEKTVPSWNKQLQNGKTFGMQDNAKEDNVKIEENAKKEEKENEEQVDESTGDEVESERDTNTSDQSDDQDEDRNTKSSNSSADDVGLISGRANISKDEKVDLAASKSLTSESVHDTNELHSANTSHDTNTTSMSSDIKQPRTRRARSLLNSDTSGEDEVSFAARRKERRARRLATDK